MSTLRFVCRADKPDKSCKCPIELIYQVSGQRKKIFLDKRYKINPVNWSMDKQRAVYLTTAQSKKLLDKELHENLDTITLAESEVNDVNDQIKAIEVKIGEIEKRFNANKITYTVSMVIDEYNSTKTPETKKDNHKDQVPDFIDNYIEIHKPNRADGSLNVYKSLKRHLLAYKENKKCVLNFETMDYSFFQGLQAYLINQGKLNNTTIAKVLTTLRATLNYAKKSGVPVNLSFRDFKIKSEKLEVIALTESEFSRLLSKDFSKNKKLDRVRDIFCFSCTTGLRVSDLTQLKREHIKNDAITINVKKTKRELVIPLNKISASILDKYKDHQKPLPMISGQKLNEYIKDACEQAKIDDPIEIVRFKGSTRETTVSPKFKLVHIHTGRKTFCTLSLERGMSAEEVMEISGHSDYHSFKRYVHVSEKRKKVVMAKAWGAAPLLKAV